MPQSASRAEALFRSHFLPLYPEDAKSDIVRARTEDANPAGNASILAHLSDAASVFVELAPKVLDAGDLALDGTDASIHRLSVALTPVRIEKLAGEENGLFNFVVHGSAYVGSCIVKQHGGVWAVRRPLWESLV